MYKRLMPVLTFALFLCNLSAAHAAPMLEVNLETTFQFSSWHSFLDLYNSQKYGSGYADTSHSMQQTVYVPAAQTFLPSSVPNTVYQLSGVTVGARYSFEAQSVVAAFDNSELFFDRETHGAFELTFQAVSPGLQGYFNAPSTNQWNLDLDNSYWFNKGGNQYDLISDNRTRGGQISVVGYDPDFGPFPINLILKDTYPLPYSTTSPEAIRVDLTATGKLTMSYEAHDDLWNLARMDLYNLQGSLFTTYYYNLIEQPAPSPVPEPASIFLLSMGLAGVAAVQKLRRRHGFQ
jgi:hypothetical protein